MRFIETGLRDEIPEKDPDKICAYIVPAGSLFYCTGRELVCEFSLAIGKWYQQRPAGRVASLINKSIMYWAIVAFTAFS